MCFLVLVKRLARKRVSEVTYFMTSVTQAACVYVCVCVCVCV